MIGYAPNQKGYKIFDESKGEIFISRVVTFSEQPSTDAIIGEGENFDSELERGDDNSPDYKPADDPDNNPDETFAKTGSDMSESASSGEVRRLSRPRKPSQRWTASALLALSPENMLTFNTVTRGEDSYKWVPAIQSEIDSIRRNNTWTLVPRTGARKILSSKWVKEALRDDGASFEKRKARIVARCFQ